MIPGRYDNKDQMLGYIALLTQIYDKVKFKTTKENFSSVGLKKADKLTLEM